MPRLPQELIDTIVYYLYDDKESIKQCSITGRSFLYSSRRILFHSIKVNCFHSNKRAEKFLKFLTSSPSIGKNIKKLQLSDGHLPRRRELPMSLSNILFRIFSNLPNIHSFELIGFGWSSEDEKIDWTQCRHPISLRELSIEQFTIAQSDNEGSHEVQFDELLDFFSIFGTIDKLTVKHIWTPGGRLEAISYETIKQWIDDPCLLERLQVSSLHLDADQQKWTSVTSDQRRFRVYTYPVDPDYINAIPILELIRRTSSPKSLALHPSTVTEAFAAKALIADSIKTLTSFSLEIVDIYDAQWFDVQSVSRPSLDHYVFDLSKCQKLNTLRFKVGANYLETHMGMCETLRTISNSSTPSSIRSITIQVTVTLSDGDWRTVTHEDLSTCVHSIQWKDIDAILTSRNFESLENVVVDLSNIALLSDRSRGASDFLTMLKEDLLCLLKQVCGKGLLTILTAADKE
ncbi:hypothetical protein C8Q75DRAFT_752792 [Abortiporus biennis]|nr:hypothetical protein C8Q75DRAFT_752792 [Abortiporus biennis]